MWTNRKARRLQDIPQATLHTPRLVLRPARLDDYEQWKTVRSLNRAYLKPFEPTWPDESLNEAFFKRRVDLLSKDWLADRTYAFLIFEGERLIGGININNVTRGAAQYASLGYWIDEMSQGYGYMSEAGNAILHFAFSHLALYRINAATLPHNRRSRAMLERLGFKEEGFASAYIQIDGRRQDHVLYGLNDADFSGAAR